MLSVITSSSNPKIKQLIALDKSRERRKQNLFTIEGLKELLLASESGYVIESVYYSTQLISEQQLIELGFGKSHLLPVGQQVFEKIAYRESTGGVIGIAKQRGNSLNDLQLGKNPLILILEGVEKPGNLGAVLRTADAAGVDAVISCDPQTDFFNPNVIRSSVGCVFTNQIAAAPSTDTIAWLKKNKIKIFCTYLGGSIPYTSASYKEPCAIVMGSESSGLTESWVKNSDANIIIPMKGKIDSMNVSVSAAIVVFEAVRQRG
ncbi:MAG TPA: rRNA methyltransferase [Cytophagales bacterium]|nr:rRNA methyltransferase [Cytophagales bacterium]HCR53006.1 rRNA methyltransferase [Cytophagales bacterium]